ncbi:MAG: hypothetical protein ACFUZC_00285 [Chthoniobacteraceae bacterium]
MDKALLIIFPYWLLFALVIGAQVYIQKFIIIPTLKKYGRDYEEYWSVKKKKKQFEEYIEVCKQHNLPDIYWKYMTFSNKVAIALVIGWICLLYFVVPPKNGINQTSHPTSLPAGH